MSDHRDEAPEKIFRELNDRPTPELESDRMWWRLRAELEPREGSLWHRVLGVGAPAPVWRLAGVAALAVVVAVVVWPRLPSETEPAAESGLVLLGPVEAVSTDALLAAASPRLEVRLVRGFERDLPADALPESLSGAGGADALADLRPTLRATLPFEQYALVGVWDGDATTGASLVDLSVTYRLAFVASATDSASAITLSEVRLEGGDEPLVAEQLTLEPGRTYLFGVRPESDSAEPGSLVLAIRIVAAASEGAEPQTSER